MQRSDREPTYRWTEAQAMERSPLARAFLESRAALSSVVDAADNRLLKRLYNVDHNAYMAGALPAQTKELMGLVASLTLRCDDCVNYHLIQSFRLGASRQELEEAINIATVVGGTIVVPHLRRAYALLAELYAEESP